MMKIGYNCELGIYHCRKDGHSCLAQCQYDYGHREYFAIFLNKNDSGDTIKFRCDKSRLLTKVALNPESFRESVKEVANE